MLEYRLFLLHVFLHYQIHISSLVLAVKSIIGLNARQFQETIINVCFENTKSP